MKLLYQTIKILEAKAGFRKGLDPDEYDAMTEKEALGYGKWVERRVKDNSIPEIHQYFPKRVCEHPEFDSDNPELFPWGCINEPNLSNLAVKLVDEIKKEREKYGPNERTLESGHLNCLRLLSLSATI